MGNGNLNYLKNSTTIPTDCLNSRDVCTYCSEEPADDSGSGLP